MLVHQSEEMELSRRCWQLPERNITHFQRINGFMPLLVASFSIQITLIPQTAALDSGRSSRTGYRRPNTDSLASNSARSWPDTRLVVQQIPVRLVAPIARAQVKYPIRNWRVKRSLPCSRTTRRRALGRAETSPDTGSGLPLVESRAANSDASLISSSLASRCGSTSVTTCWRRHSFCLPVSAEKLAAFDGKITTAI